MAFRQTPGCLWQLHFGSLFMSTPSKATPQLSAESLLVVADKHVMPLIKAKWLRRGINLQGSGSCNWRVLHASSFGWVSVTGDLTGEAVRYVEGVVSACGIFLLEYFPL